MVNRYNQKIADMIRNYFDRDNWNYHFDEENGFFRFNMTLPSKIKKVECVISVYDHDFIVYAISPVSADPENREQMMQMAEFLCRVNYRLRCGNYEMDYKDGEIRYRCYMDCGDGVFPTDDMLDNCINLPSAMFVKFGDGLLQILLNDKSAEEAIKLYK